MVLKIVYLRDHPLLCLFRKVEGVLVSKMKNNISLLKPNFEYDMKSFNKAGENNIIYWHIICLLIQK